MKKTKVMFIVSNLYTGGQERQLVELLKGLDQRDDIICELVIMAIDIHYIDLYDLKISVHYIIRKHRKDYSLFFKLFQLCKNIRPDIIHSWGPTPACYTFLIAKILKIKFVNGFIRNAFKPQIFDNNWFRSKLTFPFSDIITSNSKAGLISYGLKNSKRGIVIYNGFDFDRIKQVKDKSKIKNLFNIKTKYVVGMVASFTDKKDYETYIKSANIILNNRKDVCFLAIGDGPNLDKCKKMTKSPNFKFLGRQCDVESIVNIFDIGVLATYTEGISNSIIEYMAFSKPIIATDGGGTNEIVINDITGYLIEPKNVNQLVTKINFLLDNPDISKKMGLAGKKKITEQFILDKMVNSYLNLYKKDYEDYYE